MSDATELSDGDRLDARQVLVAGKISPNPALIRFGARIAEEGGADVPSTWAGSPVV